MYRTVVGPPDEAASVLVAEPCEQAPSARVRPAAMTGATLRLTVIFMVFLSGPAVRGIAPGRDWSAGVLVLWWAT
jgi:hypothetical protein